MNESVREKQTRDEPNRKIHPLNQLIKSDHSQYYKSQSSVTESLIITFSDTLSATQSERLDNRLNANNTVQATLKKQHLKQFSSLHVGTNTYSSLVIRNQGFEHPRGHFWFGGTQRTFKFALLHIVIHSV